MIARVLFFDIFLEKNLHLNAVENKKEDIYTWRQYGKAYKWLGFISKIRSLP